MLFWLSQPSSPSPLFSETVSHWTRSSPFWLDWQAIELLGSACLPPPPTQPLGSQVTALPCCPRFSPGCWGSELKSSHLHRSLFPLSRLPAPTQYYFKDTSSCVYVILTVVTWQNSQYCWHGHFTVSWPYFWNYDLHCFGYFCNYLHMQIFDKSLRSLLPRNGSHCDAVWFLQIAL